MKFHHIEGVKKPKSKLRWILPLFATVTFLAGGYILLLTYAPEIPALDPTPPDHVANIVKNSKPGGNGDRLYIPQLNIDIAIKTGGQESLENGAWHRVPENGDPKNGGNFVLSAHRFAMGVTPELTRIKSPFYHIEKLNEGDQFFVDYQGARYAYTVARKFQVPPTAVEIEAKGEDDKLTLYSCDLRGAAAGRYVIEARPQGQVVGLR